MKTLKRSLCLFCIVIFALIATVSCDKIQPPYTESTPPPPAPTPDDDTNDIGVVYQKFLLEEFTGHKCVNCPEAQKKSHELKEQYPNNLILLTIHAGTFSIPDNSGYYTYDFRTRAGNDIAAKYPFTFVPIGMLNRIPVDGSRLISKDNWGNELVKHIADTPYIKLSITPSFDSATRQLEVSIATTFLKELTDTFNLCVYFTEDSIIKPQKNSKTNVGPVPDWLDYAHCHILRDAITPTQGDLLASGAIQKMAKYTKTYQYNVNTAWNKNNCHIIAFIYDPGNDVIRQVEEKHIIH